MRLQCIICGHVPEYTDRYVKLESWLQGEGGSRQGVCMMVCPRHLSPEMTETLGLYNVGGFRDSSHQVDQEKTTFRES